ncbi:glycosyltransferase [Desulfotalea psychrophila]|uniref:Related to glycosyltransferase (PssE) n=1 Tax=Desulfotalea psychrophila (strain LSv54 / DSM 12343) TaxID=177439 RepID=Q6AIB2_DESPS|nr:glycosyltransferase [Desulfotalea psychrophila]CAG37935.1 related to glycosyltransferase (PssE) [Desulfotalea psychrophila LSv54]
MIFITVGTQAPFDRLVALIDKWPEINQYECFAQVANSKYIPQNIPFTNFLDERSFNERFDKAKIIISHAGMGTIISCLKSKKIILTLPRLGEYQEHRNNHQLDTTASLAERGYIYPIFNENDLVDRLSKLADLKCLKSIDDYASISLINFIKGELNNH